MTNMLKKYKLWWLICAAVFCFMSFNFILFALTGLSLMFPSSTNQGMMQFCVFFITGFITLVYSDDGTKRGILHARELWENEMNEQIELMRHRVKVAEEQLASAKVNLLVAESLPENNRFDSLAIAEDKLWDIPNQRAEGEPVEEFKFFNQMWQWKAFKDGEIIYQYGEHVPALFQKSAKLLPTALNTVTPIAEDDGFNKLNFICRVLDGVSPDKTDIQIALAMARSLKRERWTADKVMQPLKTQSTE